MTDKIARIRAALHSCIDEARREGWEGHDDEYRYSREDLEWVTRDLGYTPTRDEWREAGAGYVHGPVADAD